MSGGEFLKVFVDSNVLFSAAYRSPNIFERFWHIPDVEIVTSQYCIAEVKKNLGKVVQVGLLEALISSTEVVEDAPGDSLPNTLMLPSKDIPVLAAAALCGAQILVTGDKNHFSRYFGHIVLGVLIESPGTFRKRYPEVFPEG